MKKLFYLFTALTLLCACSDNEEDDIIWDFVPINFKFVATDADGNNLFTSLDEETREFIKGFSVEYEGKVYEPTFEWVDECSGQFNQTNQTRYYPAFFRGLYVDFKSQYDYNNESVIIGPYYLSFGEFDGASNYDDLKIVVTWPDGQKDTVEYWRKMSKLSSKNPVIKKKILVNGKEAESLILRRQF